MTQDELFHPPKKTTMVLSVVSMMETTAVKQARQHLCTLTTAGLGQTPILMLTSMAPKPIPLMQLKDTS